MSVDRQSQVSVKRLPQAAVWPTDSRPWWPLCGHIKRDRHGDTLSLADGVPLANVRDAAGHADYATTDRYANMNPDQYLAGFEDRYAGPEVAAEKAVQNG